MARNLTVWFGKQPIADARMSAGRLQAGASTRPRGTKMTERFMSLDRRGCGIHVVSPRRRGRITGHGSASGAQEQPWARVWVCCGPAGIGSGWPVGRQSGVPVRDGQPCDGSDAWCTPSRWEGAGLSSDGSEQRGCGRPVGPYGRAGVTEADPSARASLSGESRQ
jgi:hypothetical protein